MHWCDRLYRKHIQTLASSLRRYNLCNCVKGQKRKKKSGREKLKRLDHRGVGFQKKMSHVEIYVKKGVEQYSSRWKKKNLIRQDCPRRSRVHRFENGVLLAISCWGVKFTAGAYPCRVHVHEVHRRALQLGRHRDRACRLHRAAETGDSGRSRQRTE